MLVLEANGDGAIIVVLSDDSEVEIEVIKTKGVGDEWHLLKLLWVTIFAYTFSGLFPRQHQ